MPQISVVIITFNEEKNIERCILSVKRIADEIVVVDSFSTDRTEEICTSHGVRFIKNKFGGHIEQKNFAVSQAKFPHILSLDADEQLSEPLKQSILQVKDSWDADGYYFNRLTNYCGQWIRHSSWYPSPKLRLWDSRKGRWGGINPHDIFILEEGCTKKFLKGDLNHYSYYSISEHIAQINKFSEIRALSYFKEGKTVSYLTIFVRPAWRFIRDYFIKLGFLDGFYGLVICRNSSFETFLKYVKLRSLINQKKKSEKVTT
jgi:glycosyltransferase involved in cell wall biosynthesis